MSRFIGIRNNRIIIISDKNFSCDGIKSMELPPYLSDTTNKDLILNYIIKDGKLENKKAKKLAKDIKIALVGNWKMKCGISTYSEHLWGEIIPLVKDFKLFIEENEFPTGPFNEINGMSFSMDKICICWKRGESLQKLIEELKEYDPDIIWIQHEFGLWSNAMYWLSFMNQISEYRTIVTMHSVFHHKDKTICEAAMPEIVTHLQGGYNVLKLEKQIPGEVYVIPHGCYYSSEKSKLWNFYKSNRTFMQFGFGFRYKGWENAIKTTAILAKKYKDVFFTGLFSESPYNEIDHQLYYNELMELVKSLQIEENVAIIRGFQSDQTLDSYLRTNQATIFPYISHPDHEVFGASGAARLAMAKCVPVITSSVNHFQDIPSIKADTPEQMVEELEKLFSNRKVIDIQVEKQNKYIEEFSWKNVALKYLEIFEK
jgi:glycosyltransferase involved in cell wall biosynthesis